MKIYLDHSSPVPLWHQIAGRLRDAVTDGALPKGSFLDSELVLANDWNVSRPTARRASQQLVDDGLLVRRRGVGTQVVNTTVTRPFALTSLHDDLTAAGRSPSTDIISHQLETPPAIVAADLGVDPAADVISIVRLRRADGVPLALMRNWVVPEVAAGIGDDELKTGGLYQAIRARGWRPHSARQRLGAQVADDAQAERLGLRPGAPLVTLYRVVQDDTGRAIEVGDHVYDAKNYAIEMSVVDS